jgi:hypothetical protein
MHTKLIVAGMIVLASCIAVGMAFLWTRNLDPERAGVKASEERLAEVRGGGPPWGPCNCTGNCTANVPCAVAAGGNCVSTGAYCTAVPQQGNQQNKTCGNTNQFTCAPVTLSGCYTSFLTCENTAGGCTCTDNTPIGQAIGSYSSC